MEEAAGFDWLVAMDGGKILATGSPAELLDRTAAPNLDAAFIALLPEEKRKDYHEVHIAPRKPTAEGDYAIEASHLSMRFGDFTAVDNVSFKIPRGEIFGFLGSNGCGKSTTMKMLTGLLAASEGEAKLFGHKVDASDMAIRHRVGYMSQAFSLYSELTVRQNLDLHVQAAGRGNSTAYSRNGGAFRSWRGHGHAAGRPAAWHPAEAVAGGGDDPFARYSHPR